MQASRSSLNRCRFARSRPCGSNRLAASWTPTSQRSDALASCSSAFLLLSSDALRLDDHPGMALLKILPGSPGSNIAHLTPVFIVDPAELHAAQLTSRPGGAEVLSSTLTALRSQLRARGSDLVVRHGQQQDVLNQLASSSSSSSPSNETAVTSGRTALITSGASSAAAAANRFDLVASWEVPVIWDDSKFDMNFRQWSTGRGEATVPSPAPESLPPLHPALASTSGEIPTPSEFRDLVRRHQEAMAEAQEGPIPVHQASLVDLKRSIEEATTSSTEARLIAAIASNGPDPLDVLDAYLTGTSASPQLQANVAAAASELEFPSAPGSSFKSVVGSWMERGALSPRRVLERASNINVIPARYIVLVA